MAGEYTKRKGLIPDILDDDEIRRQTDEILRRTRKKAVPPKQGFQPGGANYGMPKGQSESSPSFDEDMIRTLEHPGRQMIEGYRRATNGEPFAGAGQAIGGAAEALMNVLPGVVPEALPYAPFAQTIARHLPGGNFVVDALNSPFDLLNKGLDYIEDRSKREAENIGIDPNLGLPPATARDISSGVDAVARIMAPIAIGGAAHNAFRSMRTGLPNVPNVVTEPGSAWRPSQQTALSESGSGNAEYAGRQPFMGRSPIDATYTEDYTNPMAGRELPPAARYQLPGNQTSLPTPPVPYGELPPGPARGPSGANQWSQVGPVEGDVMPEGYDPNRYDLIGSRQAPTGGPEAQKGNDIASIQQRINELKDLADKIIGQKKSPVASSNPDDAMSIANQALENTRKGNVNATQEGQQPVNDQLQHPRNAPSGAPAGSVGSGGNADGGKGQDTPEIIPGQEVHTGEQAPEAVQTEQSIIEPNPQENVLGKPIESVLGDKSQWSDLLADQITKDVQAKVHEKLGLEPPAPPTEETGNVQPPVTGEVREPAKPGTIGKLMEGTLTDRALPTDIAKFPKRTSQETNEPITNTPTPENADRSVTNTNEPEIYSEQEGKWADPDKAIAGLDPQRALQALGLTPTKDAAVRYGGQFSPKKASAQIEKVANMTNRFGQKMTYDMPPKGELPKGDLPLTWIDPNQLPKNLDANPIKDITTPGRVLSSPSNAIRKAFRGRVNNPMTDWANVNIHATQLENIMRPFADNVVKKMKADGIPSSEKELTEKIGPIFEKYQGLLNTLDTYYEKEGLSDSGKKANEKDIEETRQKVEALLEQRDKIIADMSRTSPDVRVYRAWEGSLPLDQNIKHGSGIKLTPAEVAAAKQGRLLSEKARTVLEKQGDKAVLNKEELYAPRPFIQDNSAIDFLRRDLQVNPRGHNFQHRTSESAWFPSAHMAFKQYPHSFARHAAIQPWMDKWPPFFRTATGAAKTKQLVRDFVLTQTTPPTGMDRVGTALRAAWYATKIGGAVSPAIKHMAKLAGVAAAHTVPDFSQAGVRVPLAMTQNLVGRITKNPKIAELTGVKSVDKSPAGKLLDEFTSRRIIQAAVTEANSMLGGSSAKLDKAFDAATKLTNTVAPVEKVENGINILATILSYNGIEIDPTQLRQAILDRQFETDYKPGIDAPVWMRQGWGKLLSIFQVTPWKIKEMQGKWIKDALQGKRYGGGRNAAGKSIGGQSATVRLLKYLSMIGAVEIIARKNGVSVLDMYTHMPMLKQGTGPIVPTDKNSAGYRAEFPMPSFGPSVDDLYQLEHQGFGRGGIEIASEMTPSKYAKILFGPKTSTPKVYGGSKLGYMAGIPTVKGEDRAKHVPFWPKNIMRRLMGAH